MGCGMCSPQSSVQLQACFRYSEIRSVSRPVLDTKNTYLHVPSRWGANLIYLIRSVLVRLPASIRGVSVRHSYSYSRQCASNVSLSEFDRLKKRGRERQTKKGGHTGTEKRSTWRSTQTDTPGPPAAATRL